MKLQHIPKGGEAMPIKLRRNTRFTRGSILYLSVDEIAPSPAQPRRYFAEDALDELAASIAQYGVLQPLCVRLRGGKYELVAGERRLRAARLAGLAEVPCILLEVNMEESSLIALVENLQRRDLDFVEEAEGIERLIRLFGMSQEEAARRLGRSQSAVANKLRILRLPDDILDALRAERLTERHARALLRLKDDDERRAALARIIAEGMNVAAAESYIDSLLAPAEEAPAKPPKPQRPTIVLKDVRLFLNTVTRGLDIMRAGGIAADMEKSETESEIYLTLRIPKNKTAPR